MSIEEKILERPTPGTEPSLEDKIKKLDALTRAGLYSEITPEKFPKVPPEIVFIYAFHARNNIINQLGNVREITQDPEAKTKLGAKITSLIKERDQVCNAMLGEVEGEPDEEVIFKQTTPKLTREGFAEIQSLADAGMVDALSSGQNPMLGHLSETDRNIVEISALGNRLNYLTEFKRTGAIIPTGSVPTGFSSADATPTSDRIATVIQNTRQQLKTLIDGQNPHK